LKSQFEEILFWNAVYIGIKGKFLLKQLFDDLPSVPPGIELTGHAHAEAVVLPTRDPVIKIKVVVLRIYDQHI
jgi:hypothetical protein